MIEYVWYDYVNNELFTNYLVEDIILFGEPVMKDCIFLGVL